MTSCRSTTINAFNRADTRRAPTNRSILNHFEVPTALVDAGRRLVHANAAFRQRAEDVGIDLLGGRLAFANPGAQAELRRACALLAADVEMIYAVVPTMGAAPIREIAEIRTIAWRGARTVMIWLIDLERVGRAGGRITMPARPVRPPQIAGGMTA